MKLVIKKILIILGIVLTLPITASASTLSVSPASQTLKVGETLTVTVRLDTAGTSIDGVDLRHLNFNPQFLQVVDALPAQSGIQIVAEALMPLTVLNSVDNTTGKISFSQVATGGTKYKGAGILATINFKAIAPGIAVITFNHIPYNTTDTNVAAAGKDVLTAVINGSYTISGVASKTTTKSTTATQTLGSDGKPLPEVGSAPLPDSDTTPFEFSERKTFWEIFMTMIRDFFASFLGRLGIK